MDLPTHNDVRAAHARIAPHIVRTPMLRNALLDELTGGTILLKPEPLQRTGSFKLRGATNAILQLNEAQRRAGVVTHSSGNHGQAVACAAAGIGAVATIFMPSDAPRVKQDATARWGGKIRHFNRATDDREGIARTFAEDSGAKLYSCFALEDEYQYNKSYKALDEGFRKALAARIPVASYDWCDPECVVEHGAAPKAILDLAKRVDADLIVLGARKSTFWLTRVERGLTPALLAESTCPVMTVC